LPQQRSENGGQRRPFAGDGIDIRHGKITVANSAGNAFEDVGDVELDAVHLPGAARRYRLAT
jgi:hypothetical protein